ncbi:hypothetical protein C0995_006873 [Termitomyces sp. Mi166|nr:hypothetical protein C0995_006873 [Termitomyces sp. Mi166\
MLDMPQLTALAVILVVALGLSVHTQLSKANRGHKPPPGPSGIPLLGNLLDIPGKLKHLATYFRRLLEEYGGLVSLNVRLILIGDIKLAKELLEKRAAKHSSRPVVHYIHHHLDPMEAQWVTIKEGRNHTLARKLTAGVMSTVRAGKTEPLQEFEATLNIQRLLDDGGAEWFHHMSLISASSACAAGFGIHSLNGQESDLKEILDVIDETVLLTTPSASIVNALPYLDLLPGPMPWRARARTFRKREDAIYKRVIDEAVTGKASGMNTWAAEFAREDKPEGDQRLLMKGFIGTAVSLQTFVLACIRYPEWILRAQKEIDAVVGTDRLPSFKDRPFLPYVEAIVRGGAPQVKFILKSISCPGLVESVARFGIPHQSVADDVIEYRGQEYFIPEGSIIFSVTWRVVLFEDHDRFIPERFLDTEGNLKPDYETSAFGFGRRGRSSVLTFQFSIFEPFIATMLWTFNIRGSNVPDPKTGLPFCYDDSDAAFRGDVRITSCPKPFPAAFEPRSPQRAEVARREWVECEKDLNVLLPALKER